VEVKSVCKQTVCLHFELLSDKQFQQEEQRRAEIREAQEERGRQLWQETHEAELRMTQRKIEIEKTARSSAAKFQS
jgi:hypothetical protein